MKSNEYKTIDELEDKYIGKRGTPQREEYEFDLSIEIIGEKLKQLRLERKITQEELGKLIGVQKAQISKLERGSSSSRISTINKVFNALDAQIKFQVVSY
ncbi:MAG: helix-turn-helix transcriptional regulator [Candidatus Kapabacteria bacterium]|nr:helix-turn-helix transcriptional regulator [Ignavibacteriota bacterium]MCW5884298.1 helix-turn-helix transcriptional regulator [Candidatus Kapabacteria bacterium]